MGETKKKEKVVKDPLKFPFQERNKAITIHFDKIFNQPELNVYNNFTMSVGKKRVYANFAETICDDNNMILSLDKNVGAATLLSYFNIKKAIDNRMFCKVDENYQVKSLKNWGVGRDFGKYESFINFLVSTLYTPQFIDVIKNYVEKNYEKTVDETKSANFNAGTTFTNEHFKIFYTISVMSKFAIPLCTHYIFINSDKNIEVYDFMYTIFGALFKIAAIGTNCKNLLYKLYQYVDRIVRRTENSNAAIWRNMPMYNDTRESIIEDLIIKIVTTILPKFDLEKSIISLITVVARDSVGLYKIRSKHPFDCYSINDNDRSNDDEDALSETDIFDMFYRNNDENVTILNLIGNDLTVERIATRNNTFITQAEFEYYKNNYQLHNFTVHVISLVFARFFSGVNNVKSCNFDQFIRLMIILTKKMYDLDINYLPRFITANRVSYSFNHSPSAMILKKLKEDEDYKNLIEMKYHNIQNIFEIKTTTADDMNPIKDMVIALIHNNYEINEYESKENGNPLIISEENIMKDVIKLHKMMII